MANKIALITGANKGIGFETAHQLGQQGITVLLGARDLVKGQQAADKLIKEGINAYAVKLDVTSDSDIVAVKDFIEKKYGRLDILVNNAGIAQGEELFGNSTLDVSQQALKTTFDTNFFAVVNITQQLLPLIEKSDAGRIVNLSSILGSLAEHSNENSQIAAAKGLAYNSSKTALNQFTIHLAAALKDKGIKVNSAHPGWVKTDLGSDAAPMEVTDGAKTSVTLATLDEDGPNGRFIHAGQELPW